MHNCCSPYCQEMPTYSEIICYRKITTQTHYIMCLCSDFSVTNYFTVCRHFLTIRTTAVMHVAIMAVACASIADTYELINYSDHTVQAT